MEHGLARSVPLYLDPEGHLRDGSTVTAVSVTSPTGLVASGGPRSPGGLLAVVEMGGALPSWSRLTAQAASAMVPRRLWPAARAARRHQQGREVAKSRRRAEAVAARRAQEQAAATEAACRELDAAVAAAEAALAERRRRDRRDRLYRGMGRRG